MAEITRNNSFLWSAPTLLACIFFLWMFFAAASLEQTAEMGWITASADRDARAVAYEFAARWRHGMAGNSPLYMPGFFAVAVTVWFWSARKKWQRVVIEGFLLLVIAAVIGGLLAPYTAPAIASDFVAREGFQISQAAFAGTWISSAQGVYSLLTWSTVIIAARWSITRRTFKPLLVPLALNVILALVRPWTVADFTSMWVSEALNGKPVAVFSFLLIPLIAAFMAWVELRPKFKPRVAAQRGNPWLCYVTASRYKSRQAPSERLLAWSTHDKLKHVEHSCDFRDLRSARPEKKRPTTRDDDSRC